MKQLTYWQQDAKVLENMKRFQSDVAKIRAIYGIPVEGLPEAERADWISHHTRNLDETHSKLGKLSDYEFLPQDPKFIASLEGVIAEFNLSTGWLLPIFLHILGGGKLGEPFASLPEVRPRLNDAQLPPDQQVVTRLMIEVRKDSTLEDIQALWPQVTQHQAYMEGREVQKRRPLEAKTLVKYLKIRKLEKNLRQADIATKLGLDTAKDVSDFKREVEARFKPAKSGSKARHKPPLFFH